MRGCTTQALSHASGAQQATRTGDAGSELASPPIAQRVMVSCSVTLARQGGPAGAGASRESFRRPHPLAAAHQRPRPSPHSTALGPEPAASMPGRREIEKGGRAVRRAERGRIPAGPAGSSPRGGNGARTAAAGRTLAGCASSSGARRLRACLRPALGDAQLERLQT